MSFHDSFLDGNELIAGAIGNYHAKSTKENLIAVLDAIRQRMHADGHFIFPVVMDERSDDNFAFRTLTTEDGREWLVAFTSDEEYKKGEPSQVISNFIDSTLRSALDFDVDGFIINPWGQAFLLAKELIEMIFQADGDVEYSVPEDPITPELLEDGSYLKRAVEICNRNRTELNMIKLLRILKESFVWIPCQAIMSDADDEALMKIVKDAQEKGDLESIVGTELSNQDQIRMIPDILQNGDSFFFPVFTTAEEMGEYGNQFSKIQRPFLEAVHLAENNEKKIAGIVINAFSEPFVIDKELLRLYDRQKD